MFTMAANSDIAAGTSNPRPVTRRRRRETNDDPVVSYVEEDAPAQLEVLEDEYARSILEALSDGPKRGRELIDACDGARSTVYQRVNRLVESQLVSEEMTLDPDGHHCKTFHLVHDTITVTVDSRGLEVRMEKR